MCARPLRSLWLGLGLLAAIGCARAEPPRHAVIVLIDTLRGDALEQADTPTLRALAERGVAVRRAWSAGTWTPPSVISLFTGRHVRGHGWDLGFRGSRSAEGGGGFEPLPDVPTLAEVLQGAGFQTAGIYGQRLLAWPVGFDRGFATWQRSHDAAIPGLVWEEVARWRKGDRHFLYVHLKGPHQPLRPSGAAAARWRVEDALREQPKGLSIRRARRSGGEAVETYRRAYWAAVEDTDERLGRIVEALEPHRDETLLVVTSDHGELLGEHGRMGHSGGVFEELTHVPLLVVGAGPLPPALGTAAIPDLVTRTLGVEHAWTVRADQPLPLASQRQGALALSPDGHLKGIWSADGRLAHVSDPGSGGGELRGAELAAELEAERRRFEETFPAPGARPEPIPVDDEMRSALEALGYVEETDP